MGTFTTISPGVDWQDLDFVNQLLKGFSERRQAVGGASYDSLAIGSDLQDKNVWTGLQNGIAGIVTSFCDHVNGVPIAGRDSILMFTSAAWRAAAGLHADGWRRAVAWDPASDDWTDPDDAMYSHGVMQAGDIIGPWIFDDLQKALSALKWTKNTQMGGSDNWRQYGDPEPWVVSNPCQDVRDACLAQYADHISPTFFYGCFRYAYTNGTDWTFIADRNTSKVTVSNVPQIADVACNWEVYAVAEAYGTYSAVFADLDGLGLVNGHLGLLSSGGPTSDATITTPQLPTTFPHDCATAITCPLGGFTTEGIKISSGASLAILKWNFTNSN